MPRFQIFPTDRSYSSALEAPNAADVLSVVHRLGLTEAEVDRDGEYSFSVRMDSNGLWCVFQRDNDREVETFG